MNKNFWKDRKVLITGHEGFLGSNLAVALVGLGARVAGVDRVKNRPHLVLDGFRGNIVCVKGDISVLRFVKNVINKYKPQIIFHLAAEAIVGECNKNPIKAFRSNIQGTWNILEAARDKKFIEAIIAASSDKAYGSNKVLPYKEDAPLRGAHPYDVSKSCADLICYAYWNTYKVPVCVTRCGNIYGPGDTHFSRLIPDAIRSAIDGRRFVIRSDGKFVRDYIYVEDVVKGYILLAEKIRKMKLYGEAFNLSDETPAAVIDIVKKIYALAGKRLRYKILNKVRYEIRRQYLCSKKARETLGWVPEHKLEEGLQKAGKYYRDYKKQNRRR